MKIKTTTTVEISDALGQELVSVSRTERFNIGDNPSYVYDRSALLVAENAGKVIVTAASGIGAVVHRAAGTA